MRQVQGAIGRIEHWNSYLAVCNHLTLSNHLNNLSNQPRVSLEIEMRTNIKLYWDDEDTLCLSHRFALTRTFSKPI